MLLKANVSGTYQGKPVGFVVTFENRSQHDAGNAVYEALTGGKSLSRRRRDWALYDGRPDENGSKVIVLDLFDDGRTDRLTISGMTKAPVFIPAPAAPSGWVAVEAGPQGTSLEKELNSNSPAIAPAPAPAAPGSGSAPAARAPAPAAAPAPGFSLRLGDGYPFPFPKGLSEDDEDEINQDAPNHSLTLQGVKSFEWRFELTVEFASWEAFQTAKETTGWSVWEATDKMILSAQTSDKDGREFPAVVVKDRAFCQIFIEA